MKIDKVIIHQFDPLIYPVKLWVSITSNNSALKERFIWMYDESEVDINFSKTDAITGLVRKKDNSLVGILIVFKNRKVCNIKNIAHESAHAVDDIWNRIGEKNVGHEANAYLIGWIAGCIEQAKINKTK